MLLVVFSCGKINKKNDDKIYIPVDSLLVKNVNNPLIENIQLSIPKDFDIDPNILNSIKKNNLSQNNITKDIIPILAYSNPSKKNIWLLSEYNKTIDFLLFCEKYQKVIKNKLKSDKMNVNYFSNNKIEFCQIMIYSSKYINIKLVFKENSKIYIYEFIITREYYKKNIKSIESSIGQIKKEAIK